MKGVILAGGLGTRLYPLTQVTNKHLLPVFDKPMIYYPIQTLVKAGVKDLLVIVSGPHSGAFLPILKNGREFGLSHIEYAVQTKPDGGIADALALAEDFADGENIAVMLGDNTMDDETISESFAAFKGGAHIFLKTMIDPSQFGFLKTVEPSQFGVPRLDACGNIIEIIEKPATPPSPYAVIGLYLYDNKVFDHIKTCVPSARGQLEITDVNNAYLTFNQLSYSVITGFWKDAGTFENLFEANQYWYKKHHYGT